MKHQFILLALFSMLLHSCQDAQETVNYFSNNAFGNPIVGHNGEHYKGVTYVGYQGEKEDPYVVAYDHNKKEWIGPYKVGTSLLGKTPGKRIDNHGKPTLIVDADGYIHVVFGGHGGSPALGENKLGNYNAGKQIHMVTKNPMDISSWEEMDNLPPFATYSQFLKMDNGDLFLFYRHGAHRSNWVYQVSKDNGRTFTSKVSIVKAKPTKATAQCSDIFDSWYLDFQHGAGNDIIVNYNYHICKNMKPHYSERNNAYYMIFDTDKKSWYNIKGQKLELPITKEYADAMTLAVNTGDKWVQNGTSCLDNQGRPHISFYQGENDGSVNGSPKQLSHYWWNGKEWQGGAAGVPVEARGEMVAKSPSELSFLLGNGQDGYGEVAWWHSNDSGQTFTKEQVCINAKGGRFTLANFIKNAHPDARIVATQKIEGTPYSKIYLLGENGPIKRSKEEAEVLNLVDNQK